MARAIIATAAIGGAGAFMLLPLNQWDGVAAIGLALAYADLRAGRDSSAMVWLTLTALAGKPHLAIGVALFLIARRPKSIVPGALAAAGLWGFALLVVPVTAIGQLLSSIVQATNAFPVSTTIGMNGLADSFLGSTPAATVTGYMLAAGALVTCFALGRWARHGRGLDPVFLAVTLLSVLAAPHVFPYDLVLLIPGFIGCVAWASAHDAASVWPGRTTLAVVGAWFAITLVCLEMVMPPGSYRPTPLLAMLLLACAAGCVAAATRGPRSHLLRAAPNPALS
jgi:hypothetical protein